MAGRAPYDVRPVPGQRCKRSAGQRTVPGRLYTNFHVQLCIRLYQISIIPPKKQVVKIRKIAADYNSDGDKYHTCASLQNFQ